MCIDAIPLKNMPFIHNLDSLLSVYCRTPLSQAAKKNQEIKF